VRLTYQAATVKQLVGSVEMKIDSSHHAGRLNGCWRPHSAFSPGHQETREERHGTSAGSFIGT
jgi:hypothetical protein